MNYSSCLAKLVLLCASGVLAAACSDGSLKLFPHSIGGSISGLPAGSTVVLDDGGIALSLSTNGSFTFPNAVPSGKSYAITVAVQPQGGSCTVSNGAGVVGPTNVTNVIVTCSGDTHTVGGTVSGLLSGRSLVLEDNGANAITVSANGSFSFSAPIEVGANYAVTVATQPAGQSCSVTNGSGTIGSADVANVAVSCSGSSYNVSVTITGLTTSGLTLELNGTQTLAITSNGTFNFNTPLASGTAYSVGLASEPAGDDCSVSNASGTVGSGNVSGITVTCIANLYVVSGSVSGLLSGNNVVLQDNGGNSTTVSGNGGFIFSMQVASGKNYAVTVFTQPAGQTCAVSMGSGVVAASNITDVSVNCSANAYNIGVTASGVLRSGLTLQDNGADNLAISASGSYNFNTPLASGSPYAVTVLTSPPGENCSVSNGTGVVAAANVSGIPVTCTPIDYTIGGTVSGLNSGKSVTLEDNLGNATVVSANGAFTFSTSIASGGAYSVTVSTQPAGQNCSVSNASGTVLSSNISNVSVTCSSNSYNVLAAVSGINASGLVLQDNGADNLTVPSTPSSGTYTFATSVASGASYNVTVFSQPTGETCTVTSGSGTIGSSNVTATVTCAPITYTISGTVTGLIAGNHVSLQDNGADTTTVTYPGTSFSFSTQLASGSDYLVTVSTQPTGQQCNVTNGSGMVAGANVSNVVVDCSTSSYSIGGTVSGLSGMVTLQDNGGDNLTLSANGPFTFPTDIPEGGTYSVTVLTQPTGQVCSVTNGSGTVSGGSNVSNVTVTCVNTFTVGGTVTGLSSGTLVLQDNLGDNLTVTTNGSFTFATPIKQGATYSVTVLTQPAGQTCTVSGGSGTMGGANVTSVTVVCEGDWTWMNGAKTQGAAGTYGTKGVAAAANTPGARYSSVTWAGAGGTLWLFGGAGYAASNNVYFNDLWQYTPGTGWAWINGASTTNAGGTYGMLGQGSSTYTPGARSGVVSWVDATGNLWLFGGYGYDVNGTLGYLDDLWTYSVSAGTWTWVAGTNTVNTAGSYGGGSGYFPGARNGAVSWTDSSGNFWLFGGDGEAASGSGFLNDLWEYNTTSGNWTWVAGSSSADAAGVYTGTPTPGARQVASSWVDPSGHLWLFGGQGYDVASHEGYMNDLWMFDPTSSAWTWVGGSSSVGALANYGTKGVSAATNVPGARGSANAWADASGNLWMFGGYAYNASGAQGSVNDLWTYNITSTEWTWIGGSSSLGVEGTYGTKGTAAATNVPGARYSAVSWFDSSGNFWLFGGQGVDGSNSPGVLNDLWKYVP